MKNLLLLFIFLSSLSGYSCSAFKYINGNNIYVAKNFDWYFGQGYVLKNNRSVNKCTYLKYNGNNTCWTSKYGSVTFNQNGKELPYGGINEKGLVVEMLWLKETFYKEYEKNATKISELEWIQYQLDNFKSVEEVIANIEKLEIDPITATIHYFIADNLGKSAVIEYINGEVVITKSDDDIQAITNTSANDSHAFYERNKSKLGDTYIPKQKQSTHRYCSVQNNLEKLSKEKDFGTTTAFQILDNVAENKENYKTFWNIVYDVTNLKITFKTFQNRNEKSINIQDLDFESEQTTFYDLSSSDATENISGALAAYTSIENMKLIEQSVMPSLKLNYEQLNKHLLNPAKSNIDAEYSQNHMDVTVTILTETDSGTVKYYLSDSEENYNRQGPYGAAVEIKSNKTIHKLYALPLNSTFAYGAYHDANGNGFLDRNLLKMPKEPYAFSGKKRMFGLPPKFKKAAFELTDEIVIDLR